jgi:hypothetical protein
MSLNYGKIAKEMKEWAESPEGIAIRNEFVEKMAKKLRIAEGRYEKFEKYLETHDFEVLMQRLIQEHGEEWQDKCYKKYYEPYPNNKLRFVIDYLVHNYEPIEVLEIEPEHFPSTIYFLKGYYFQTICGQGCFHRIYNKEGMQMVLQV